MRVVETPRWLDFFGADFSKLLPHDWDSRILELVDLKGRNTVLDGGSETSREAPGTKIPVKVVEGQEIAESQPWLFELYERQFKDFATRCFEKVLYECNVVDDAVNINCIEGRSARYEWHVDTNPVTGILFLDSFEEDDGGALVFRKHDEVFRFLPKSGWFCCFSAEDVDHRVEPLIGAERRISVPMNYYYDRNNSGRDPALKSYLSQQG